MEIRGLYLGNQEHPVQIWMASWIWIVELLQEKEASKEKRLRVRVRVRVRVSSVIARVSRAAPSLCHLRVVIFQLLSRVFRKPAAGFKLLSK